MGGGNNGLSFVIVFEMSVLHSDLYVTHRSIAPCLIIYDVEIELESVGFDVFHE